ncbi:A-kinase anchor protein 4 [Pogona vitticeps]|uniref:A-kinase anchor protein 4-like n=1 Tax=Pogona vitticeps TaxID=103695 RepID=A0A6J0TTK2_9SAUR|nr:A-kinase anchor protein 4-like [Pogona vitticeps]
MAQEIDWLHSQAGLCKVDLYSPDGTSDQDRKVICFVDVASLNLKNKEKQKRGNSLGDPSLDLRNLEEKEVIVIKDNERDHHTNTEGAVCLFKQGSSEEVNVVSWLSNDLQKYAVGFQHALTPSGSRKSAYDSPAFDKMSQSSDTSFRGSGGQRGDDLSYYVNKLCSLVVQMAHKEMKDKLESSGRCIRQSINSRGPNGKADDYGKLSPKSSHDDPRKASLFYGEMSNQSNQNGYRQGSDRQMSERKQSGQDDGSVSKGLMVYANQVASDMMFSFMKTMKVQKGKHPPPACVVLKKVLLKHTRDVISDLIDSTMKNLHNVTGALMTDSDFVNTVKKNLFNTGTQKSTEILEAMVKRLFKALAGDDKKSQSLAFTALKAGTHTDSRTQGLQFATLKSEMHGGHGGGRGNGQVRPLPSGSKGSDKHCSMDVYAKDLIVTALMLIQQHLLEKNKDQGFRETNTTSFGYVHDRTGGSKYGSRPGGGRQDNLESQKGDISSILLSIIQKVLREAGFADETTSDKGYKQPPFVDSRPQRALPKGGPEMYDNMEQINKQFIDQLVESVMKLCMLMAKGSDSEGRYGRPLGSGSEVIVNNQNCNNSAQNKELQAVLQWLVASQFNVPNLTFMNEQDGELSRLPQLADKAAKKGYSVGDIVQEVMRYYEKQQMDAMAGRMPRCGLVDYLLANL